VRREFTSQENQPGGAHTVVISNHLWKERFGGRPEALSKTVTLDGVDYSIAGFAPPGFRVNGDADVYTPLGQFDSLILNNRATHDGIFALARLKPGVRESATIA
jgi:MacB-like periplasmic core domain